MKAYLLTNNITFYKKKKTNKQDILESSLSLSVLRLAVKIDEQKRDDSQAAKAPFVFLSLSSCVSLHKYEAII